MKGLTLNTEKVTFCGKIIVVLYIIIAVAIWVSGWSFVRGAMAFFLYMIYVIATVIGVLAGAWWYDDITDNNKH